MLILYTDYDVFIKIRPNVNIPHGISTTQTTILLLLYIYRDVIPATTTNPFLPPPFLRKNPRNLNLPPIFIAPQRGTTIETLLSLSLFFEGIYMFTYLYINIYFSYLYNMECIYSRRDILKEKRRISAPLEL